VAASIITCPNCGKRNRVTPSGEGVPRCAVCHSLLPWLVKAGPDSFEAEVAASVPVLVDLWAPWCVPCKFVEPIIDELVRSRAGELKVVKVNVDEAPDIASRFGVKGIPTLVLMRDGNEVDRLTGAPSKPQLDAWVERQLRRADQEVGLS
jgi:thioredoxin 2